MAVSRYSAAAAFRMARCQFLGELPIDGDVYAALSMSEIDDTDLGTEFLADLTWDEYDGTYDRQQIVIADVILGDVWKLRAGAPTDFGTPDAPTSPAVALVLYQGTSAEGTDDATAHVLGWIQGVDIPFFPFDGDGATPLTFNWPGGGVILQGPNC